ncbi:MAG: hypothetical protein LBQ89_07920 [Treponema sp.]|jgi:hypothetical protein|nr:hypothetical protein [Treponema sp.]
MTPRTLVTGEILNNLETVVLYDILHECACNDIKSMLVRGVAAKLRDALYSDAREIKAKHGIEDKTQQGQGIKITSKEVDKLVQNFCEKQLWDKNMICRSLTENFPESCASLNQCPLFLFKVYLMEKIGE